MLNPESMEKVTIIGPKTVMEKTVKELHHLKAIHITDHKKGEFDIGSPFESADQLSQLLVSVRATAASLKISGKKELSNGFRAVGVKSFAELGRAVKKLDSEMGEIQALRQEALDELKDIIPKEAQLSFLQQLGLRPDSFTGYKSLSYFVGKVKELQPLQKALLTLTDKFELFHAEKGSEHMIALFVEAGKKAEAAHLLTKHGFIETPLTEIKGLSGSVDAAVEAVGKRKAKLQKQIEAADKALSALAVKWSDFLILSDQLLMTEKEKADAPMRFGVSRNAFIIKGWVPEKELGNLESHLSKATGERIYVEAKPPHHNDNVPVVLKNPPLARPFEFFMRLYTLPRYDEIDPTIFMLFTFPILFGFMLGDVGYGLVTFFLLLWLRKKMSKAASLINVAIPAAAASIIFGFIFGEVFGFEQAFGFEFPRLINRAVDINTMIYVAVGVGVLHLNMGFILGFVNELHHKGLFKAFAAKLSWIILEGGIALIVLPKMGILKVPSSVGYVVGGIAVVLIYIGESFRGVMELPALMSNSLSYARLAAIGLSSVSLAVVINGMAEGMARSGPVGIAAAVLILFMGHTINLALGLLGSFLHSLRLHYVEFFTKFFQGGAIPFKPFGLKASN